MMIQKIFLDSHYGAHYLTAFEIFKDNPFIGVEIRCTERNVVMRNMKI